jgi:hypothetical protein
MFPFHFVLSSHSHHELLRGESITKHGKAADGFGLGRLVLQDIPMLLKETVFESDNVGGDPGRGSSVSGETAVRDDVIPFCNMH